MVYLRVAGVTLLIIIMVYVTMDAVDAIQFAQVSHSERIFADSMRVQARLLQDSTLGSQISKCTTPWLSRNGVAVAVHRYSRANRSPAKHVMFIPGLHQAPLRHEYVYI